MGSAKLIISRNSSYATIMEKTYLVLRTLNGKIILRTHILDEDDPLLGILAT